MTNHYRQVLAKTVGSVVGKRDDSVYGYTPVAKPTAQDKRRAKFAALVASLHVPQHTSIVTTPAAKARPGVGAFASI